MYRDWIIAGDGCCSHQQNIKEISGQKTYPLLGCIKFQVGTTLMEKGKISRQTNVQQTKITYSAKKN